MKRVVLMSIQFSPIVELVPASVAGLVRISYGLSEFIRRPDLDTDTTQMWMELPQTVVPIEDKDVVRWFDHEGEN